jgi:hypothetical protein
MATIRRVVDDRTFLRGLDGLYRRVMKWHERGEFLAAARVVTGALGVGPADVPIEGYYADDTLLSEYFLLMRSLQDFPRSAASKVVTMPEFHRLQELTSSPIYGVAIDRGKLLPVGRDALAQALLDTFPHWDVESVVRAAGQVARARDEISLVGLAARAGDAVLLAAFAESTVLYREMLIGRLPPEYEYVWEVSAEIEEAARQFAEALGTLLRVEPPPVGAPFAQDYWLAAEDNPLAMRCVRLGEDPGRSDRYYHWAIRPSRRAGNGLEIDEFWSPDTWTTRRYKAERFEPRTANTDGGRWTPPGDKSLQPEDGDS